MVPGTLKVWEGYFTEGKCPFGADLSGGNVIVPVETVQGVIVLLPI